MERQTPAYFAALRRFPAQGDEIESLINRNDDFFDMCEELAEADNILAHIDQVPPIERKERTLECHDWIERLTSEIADTLNQANVVPFGSCTRKGKN